LIRTFIAAPVTDSVREAVGGLIRKLSSSGADVKWVAAKNIHITLKFLGEIKPERIDPVVDAVRRLQTHPPIRAVLEGTGVFPNWKRPSVLWAGVTAGKEELVRLAHETEEAMSGLGFEREARPFSPHLTIGRVRSMKRIETLPPLMEGFGPVEWPISTIHVMKSELTPAGPIYSVLATIELEG
jgi:RNA 2',3'-cyclic 3'-phosphodiesterase